MIPEILAILAFMLQKSHLRENERSAPSAFASSVITFAISAVYPPPELKLE